MYKRQDTLRTDAEGNTNIVMLHAGTYYIKEISASAGYLLCNENDGETVVDGIHRAVVTPKETTQIAVSYTHLDVYKRQVLIGLGVILMGYPWFSNWLYQHHVASSANVYEQYAAESGTSEITKQLETARRYNQELNNSRVMLTEPYCDIRCV